MTSWLVCKRCGVKEAILPCTKLSGCTTCGEARFAENDDGEPMVIWSVPQNPDSFDTGNPE
jgi:hypothetical protein